MAHGHPATYLGNKSDEPSSLQYNNHAVQNIRSPAQELDLLEDKSQIAELSEQQLDQEEHPSWFIDVGPTPSRQQQQHQPPLALEQEQSPPDLTARIDQLIDQVVFGHSKTPMHDETDPNQSVTMNRHLGPNQTPTNKKEKRTKKSQPMIPESLQNIQIKTEIADEQSCHEPAETQSPDKVASLSATDIKHEQSCFEPGETQSPDKVASLSASDIKHEPLDIDLDPGSGVPCPDFGQDYAGTFNC